MDIHTACFQYCTSKAIHPSTIQSYENVVRTFVGNTGITGLEQITPELLTEWKNVMAKRSSASTFNNYYRHLSALFNYCVKKKLLAVNPLTDVLKFTRVSSRGKTADLSDLKKVCSYLNSLAGTSPGYGAPLCLQHRHHAQTVKITPMPTKPVSGLTRGRKSSELTNPGLEGCAESVYYSIRRQSACLT